MLFNDTHAPGSFTALQGIRGITVTWIVVLHTYVLFQNIAGSYLKFPLIFIKLTNVLFFLLLGNSFEFVKMLDSFTFQAIINGQIGVDTFFVLSGFLTTYSFVKDMKKTNNRLTIRKIINHYVHRFWRILPMLTGVICFYATIFPRIRQGPGNILEVSGDGGDLDKCKRYWWRNFLFIQNLFGLPEAV